MRFRPVGALLLLAGILGACSTGGASTDVLPDTRAIVVSGATSCVLRPDVVMVRSEYECANGETLSTFNSAQQRQMMAKLADGAGFQRVVRQDANWMVTK